MEHIAIPSKAGNETGRQYAYRVLYRAIMTLELEPGAQLQDTELSKMLGISRTPVREAIMSLQDARLVEVYPQRSSCVSRINLDYVEEGIFLRYNIEKAIVEEAMYTSDGAALARIRENLAQQKLFLDTRSNQDFTELDNAFHQLIYLAARKPWAWDTITRIATHHDRVRRLQTRMAGQPMLALYDDHCALFEAIITRNSAGMDDLLYRHLTEGYRSALPTLMREYPDYFAH